MDASEEQNSTPTLTTTTRRNKNLLNLQAKYNLLHSTFNNAIQKLNPKERRSFKPVLRKFENFTSSINNIGKKQKQKHTSTVKREYFFEKKKPVYPEVLEAMGLPENTEISWHDVNAFINTYIKQNNLKNQTTHPVTISLDAVDGKVNALKKIMKLEDGFVLTYKQLQVLARRCFPDLMMKDETKSAKNKEMQTEQDKQVDDE